MGYDTSYTEKNNNLISRLEGVPDEERTARFVCAMAAVFPDGREETVVGTMEGRIGYEIAGENAGAVVGNRHFQTASFAKV